MSGSALVVAQCRMRRYVSIRAWCGVSVPPNRRRPVRPTSHHGLGRWAAHRSSAVAVFYGLDAENTIGCGNREQAPLMARRARLGISRTRGASSSPPTSFKAKSLQMLVLVLDDCIGPNAFRERRKSGIANVIQTEERSPELQPRLTKVTRRCVIDIEAVP